MEYHNNDALLVDLSTVDAVPDEPQAEIPPIANPINDQNIALLLHEMQALRTDFDTKIKYDHNKTQLIDSLHSELQTYREGLHFKLLRPMIMDLISMYDDLGKLTDTMHSNPAITSNLELEQAFQNLCSFQDTIELTLQRHNVETFMVPEKFFTANRQRIVKVINTPDATLARQIARRIRKGFIYDNKVLRPELVDIYKFDAPTETP